MKKPVWFADEIVRISKKNKITAIEAERVILERIDEFAEETEGNLVAAYDAYNLERVDSIDEDYYVELYVKEKGVTEDVARALFNSIPF